VLVRIFKGRKEVWRRGKGKGKWKWKWVREGRERGDKQK